MAGINYYVVSVLATDAFWDGRGFEALERAIKYSSYASASAAISDISSNSRISNLEIRQMLVY